MLPYGVRGSQIDDGGRAGSAHQPAREPGYHSCRSRPMRVSAPAIPNAQAAENTVTINGGKPSRSAYRLYTGAPDGLLHHGLYGPTFL